MKDLKKIILEEGLEYKELEDGTLLIQKKERVPFELELGKDYIHNDGDWLVIDRIGNCGNSGFIRNGVRFATNLFCSNPKSWREATKEEVKRFFERHLIKRYGEDWKNVKVKECVKLGVTFNDYDLSVVIVKRIDTGWEVWNSNHCLYNNGKWAEVLEEKKTATDLSDIGRPYYIDSFGAAGKTDEFKTITKNHMTSKELCEGILALQQLISFRDDFHKVHGRNYYNIEGAICLTNESDGSSYFKALYIHSDANYVDLFDFDTHDQAKEFLSTHKDLFEELKKLY